MDLSLGWYPLVLKSTWLATAYVMMAAMITTMYVGWPIMKSNMETSPFTIVSMIELMYMMYS